jgi:flagellar L-ring protein precursor FlgH
MGRSQAAGRLQRHLAAAARPRPADGAIFNASAGYAGLVEGRRAHAVGDPLTIVLVEQMTTSKSASSKTDRAGSANIVPPSAGPLSFLDPNALKASAGSSFNGKGNAAQTNSLGVRRHDRGSATERHRPRQRKSACC